MSKTKKTTPALDGNKSPKLEGKRFKELDARTAKELESREVKAIQGDGEEWWCPNNSDVNFRDHTK